MESDLNFTNQKNYNPGDIDAMRAKLNLFVDEYSKRLNVGVQNKFEKQLVTLRTQLDNASKEAVEAYNNEMKELEAYKDMSDLYNPAKDAVVRQLKLRLEAYQQLIDRFITNCKDLISD